MKVPFFKMATKMSTGTCLFADSIGLQCLKILFQLNLAAKMEFFVSNLFIRMFRFSQNSHCHFVCSLFVKIFNMASKMVSDTLKWSYTDVHIVYNGAFSKLF